MVCPYNGVTIKKNEAPLDRCANNAWISKTDYVVSPTKVKVQNNFEWYVVSDIQCKVFKS